jgi:regulatory protein
MKERTTYDRALHLLGFRARSVSELRRRLLRAGEPASSVDEAIERLLSQKLLDDEDFARQFARTKLVAAGASRRRILQELQRRGIPRETSERAVDSMVESEGLDTTSAAHAVAEKKWASLKSLDEATRRRRLYAFLARRGFDPDEIRDVMGTIGRDAAE